MATQDSTDLFDLEADAVVVGLGAAGAAAAITASDARASVIIVEKQPKATHSPTSLGPSIVLAVDDVDRATDYLDRCAGGLTPRAVSQAFAARAHQLPEWLDRVADLKMVHLRYVRFTDFDGADALRVFIVVPHDSGVRVSAPGSSPFGAPVDADGPQPRGEDMFEALLSAIEKRDNIEVLWGSPAVRLIQDSDGRVVGVETTADSGKRRVKARRGVVLSCGGYGASEEIKQQFMPAYPVYTYGSHSSTGDGVRMAQAVGADLWHMGHMPGRAIGHFVQEDETDINFIMFLKPPGYVLTDKYGKRFANEYEQARIIEHTFYFELIKFDPLTSDFPRIPCYWLFDHARFSAGRLASAGSRRSYRWSDDNQAELDLGWIHRGGSIEEAAARAGMIDPAEAEQTVAEYNRHCVDGLDPLGRPKETLVPIMTPPYYCIPLFPGGPTTFGGPRRNEHAQVLDPFGAPIPGLFAAGELGSALGRLYPSSGSPLAEALCFGQIAAESALRH
jgi:succinate dehydrogenase/fumarate reductase flavoprotein subunit